MFHGSFSHQINVATLENKRTSLRGKGIDFRERCFAAKEKKGPPNYCTLPKTNSSPPKNDEIPSSESPRFPPIFRGEKHVTVVSQFRVSVKENSWQLSVTGWILFPPGRGRKNPS